MTQPASEMDPTQAEFPQIYTAYWPKIARYLARLVGEDEAEDLAQDVFLKARQALPGFRGEASLSTWLYRIATNTAYDRLRSPAFRSIQAGLSPDEDDKRGVCYREEKPTIEQQVVKHEMGSCLIGYINRLPESYRLVLLLGDLEELSNQEIANILGISLGNVKTRLHRARASLREALETNCEYYWLSELGWHPA